MARGKTRGVSVAVAILLALATACLIVSFNAENPFGGSMLWYIASGALFATAALVYVAAYWVLPRFRRSRASGQPISITVDNSPDTIVEANAPRDSFGEIAVKDSPGTELRFNEAEESDEEANANSRDSDPSDA